MIIILYLGVLLVGFYFLLVRPQRKQMAARRALVAAIEVGDEVMTAGGIHGRVDSIDGEIIGLEVAPGVVIRIARGAISARPSAEATESVPDTPGDAAAAAGSADPATEDDGEV